MQKAFDELYQQSKNGNNFYKLLEIIGSEQNICLAYRNLKTNSGSKTAGTDGKTIEDIKGLSDREVIETVRKQLADYHPQSVRRVFIPKPGSDKKRPLGIPCIWDRLIQQCILQVLEPICEPKFHNHSYGFRQNRDAHHAVSRVVSMVNMYKHYYCVDVDIKGFFDNVNHGKLLKQIWTLGIRDKRLLCIISKILKSEIEGEGIPDKGTPQGGLISPLLSLIVLNELDWWVSSQWETFTPNGVKKGNMKGSKGWLSYARKYTNLKDGYVVRYADDFKIMCRSYTDAQRYYHATIDFLKSRLKLDISPEKSKVVNLRKNSSDFLGLKIKVLPKGKTRYGYIAKTDMSDKAIKKVTAELKAKVINIRKHTTVGRINAYNMAVIGIQNYYCIATNIYNNLTDVNYALLPTFRTRLSCIESTIPFAETPYEFQQKTVGIKKETKIITVGKMPLLPLTGVHHKHPINFSQKTNVDTKNRIIAYDIRELGEQLMPLGMLVTLDSIFNRVIQNWKKGKTTWIFADEFYLLFRYQYSADFFYRLYKRIRKYQGFVTGLTQNVEELLKSDTARLMLANSEFLILLNQATTDRDELASLLNISENQLSYITNVGAGKGLIRCSGNLVPFENSFPKNTKLYRLMTTKPGEC